MTHRTPYILAAILLASILTVSSTEASEETKSDLERTVSVLADLHKYFGNTFVWQKKILAAGQVCSAMIPQVPIRMFDGRLGKDKAVKVCIGAIGKDGRFERNKNGDFVKVDLYSDEMYDAGSIMMLTKEGAGAAASCWKGGEVMPKYNCFFRIQPASDGGVLMRWTMYHPGSLTELKTVDPTMSILKGTSVDIRIMPADLQLPEGSTFETE